MAFDAFMYAEGIEGETQDSAMKAKKAFELKHFDFGAENTINIGSASGGGGAGKATFKDFNVTKQTDNGSCALFTKLCTGKHISEGTIELRRSGGSEEESGATFMKFVFKLLMVKDITWSGDDGDDVPTEEVTFEYGAIVIEYSKQKKDGTMEKSSEAKWSRVVNKATDAVE
jgi:type VI secretion system secreted protein Hcp